MGGLDIVSQLIAGLWLESATAERLV